MDLAKILELLGANKLDENTQGDLKEKLETIIEVEAKKLSDASLTEAKEILVQDYEKKFDEYKEDITSKFSNFVDGVFEDELTIPEQVLEYAKKGELYNDLIEQFKIRLGVDQGLLDEEIKSLLKEAKEEIIKLRTSQDKSIAENLEVKQDAQELAATVYLYQKCQGLTESQRKQVFDIIGDATDRLEIDRKFKVIAESERFDPVNVGDDEIEDVEKKNKKKADPKNNEKEVSEQEEEDEEKNGKGKSEVEDDDEEDEDEKKKKVEEANSPFTQFKNQYLQVLKENKI
ncbi:MAG TPA: hypothetical protein VMZ91_09615 [Candidatus Paceibacterota bacterium]|nr:hypothetical protein [Candidatus Paceibacterota bacterium]